VIFILTSVISWAELWAQGHWRNESTSYKSDEPFFSWRANI